MLLCVPVYPTPRKYLATAATKQEEGQCNLALDSSVTWDTQVFQHMPNHFLSKFTQAQ